MSDSVTALPQRSSRSGSGRGDAHKASPRSDRARADWRKRFEIAILSGPAIVMFLVASALVSSWLITIAEIPQQVVEMLRPFMDKYFDDVLVMAEDEAVRLNRLRQLAAVAGSVKKVAWLEFVQG